jgi:hypothetical protein
MGHDNKAGLNILLYKVSFLKDLNEEDIFESVENGKLRGDAGGLLVDCFSNIAAAHLQDQDYGKVKVPQRMP